MAGGEGCLDTAFVERERERERTWGAKMGDGRWEVKSGERRRAPHAGIDLRWAPLQGPQPLTGAGISVTTRLAPHMQPDARFPRQLCNLFCLVSESAPDSTLPTTTSSRISSTRRTTCFRAGSLTVAREPWTPQAGRACTTKTPRRRSSPSSSSTRRPWTRRRPLPPTRRAASPPAKTPRHKTKAEMAQYAAARPAQPATWA